MNLRKFGSAAAIAAVAFGLAASSFAQAGTVRYHMEQRVNWTTVACGYTVSGWLHEQQQYTLTPTGQLNFHYIANGQASGVDGSGNRVELKLNNKELDHILQTTPPNLAPYGGSLQGWVADNADVIVEINAQFNERTVKPGNGGRVLKNHWVFQVNHNGTTVDSVQFVGTCN